MPRVFMLEVDKNVPKFGNFLITITNALITISSIFVMYFVLSGGDQEL